MKEISIVNTEFLEILKQWEWFYNNRDYLDSRMAMYGLDENGQRNIADYNFWTGKEHLDQILKQGRHHEGYPDGMLAYNIRPDQSKWRHNLMCSDLFDKYNDLNDQMMIELSTRHNALCTLYPPGGFLSWHNNANASSQNLIFTWSETGEGCFQYIDGETNELVVLQDKPGWQCRYGYFGSYRDSPDKLVYHSAKTDCWRMTVSYIYEAHGGSTSEDFQLDVIQDILSS